LKNSAPIKPTKENSTMKPQDLHALALAALQPFKTTTAADDMAAKVDRLGAINATAAALKKESDQLRTELEAAGLTNIDGQLYRVNFSTVAGRTVTDWEAIAKRFKPSAQLIRANTTTAAGSTRMTIKAHKTA
jgi:hypothetical protein